MDLEAAGGLVHAAVIGSGAAIQIDTSPVSSDRWTTSPTTVALGAGPVPSAQIVLQGRAGWLVEDDRTVISGARLEQGRWVAWQPPCLSVEGPAVLAASTATDLVSVCDEGLWGGSSTAVERAFVSHDGGTTFQATPAGPPSTYQGALLVASPSPQTIIVASYSQAANPVTGVLLASFDGGATWAQVAQSAPTWDELGFTTATQGIAVASHSNPAGGAMMMTYDGGHTWNPVTFRPAS